MDFNFMDHGGWQNQDRVYIVMYRSRKSGGTYTEVRRTSRGLVRLLETLRHLGYKPSEIEVTEKPKKWMPEKRTKTTRKKKGYPAQSPNLENPKEIAVNHHAKVIPFAARA